MPFRDPKQRREYDRQRGKTAKRRDAARRIYANSSEMVIKRTSERRRQRYAEMPEVAARDIAQRVLCKQGGLKRSQLDSALVEAKTMQVLVGRLLKEAARQ